MSPLPVRGQVARLGRREIALAALVRLVASVLPLVHDEVARVGGAVVTLVTLVGLLPCVRPPVAGESARVGRGVVALFALEGLLARVSPLMPLVIGGDGGAEAAVAASVPLLALIRLGPGPFLVVPCLLMQGQIPGMKCLVLALVATV